MEIKKITCIQFFGEFPDFCSRIVMPDYGLPVIGTILSEMGYDVKVYVERIKPPEWDRIAASDLICFSSWCAGADKMHRLAREIQSRLGIPIIIGGVYASYFPESCLQHCDYVVFGEGDETIVELVETLTKEGELNQVSGIAYRVGDQVHFTLQRSGPSKFNTIPNYSLIEGYPRMGILDILMQRKKPWMTVQASRGCPFNCAFCIVHTMFHGSYRTREIESVIADLRDKRQYGRQLIFVDNEFAADRSYAKKLLRRIIEEDFGFKMTVFARVEVIEDDELLSLMRRAGVTHIYQGYESIHPETLSAFNKRQDLEQIEAAIQKLHSLGFGILGSFVMGADTDTLETTQRTVDFVLHQKLFNAYFWPIMGLFPEKRLGYQTIIPWYRGIFLEWKYYDGYFVTHFPLQMTPSQLQRSLINAYRSIYAPTQVVQALKDRKFGDAKAKILLRYLWRDIEKGAQEYLPFLEELEDGLYDTGGSLREDLLMQRIAKNPQWTFQAGKQAIEDHGILQSKFPTIDKEDITCISKKLGSSR